MMNKERVILSSVERRPPHVSMTHFLRRKWARNPLLIHAMLSKCAVSPYLGALPPELRARVPQARLSDVTHQFRMKLENFLIDKISEINQIPDKQIYHLDEIGQLFNTSCVLEVSAVNVAGFRTWSGFAGVVFKMSFPELNAEYAIKVFDKHQTDVYGHGAMYEIPAALAAAHAEPRDNARVYMASFIYEPYMLSRWEGDMIDGAVRKNRNEIFKTSEEEAAPRNYRGGRRIDFGETRRTVYGAASYRVRKMYRKITNAIDGKDFSGLSKMMQDAAKSATPAERKDFFEALDLVSIMAEQNIHKLAENTL